jgi:hypothetical protein
MLTDKFVFVKVYKKKGLLGNWLGKFMNVLYYNVLRYRSASGNKLKNRKENRPPNQL